MVQMVSLAGRMKTPTSQIGKTEMLEGSSLQKGFTLLELLVVLIIIAISFGVFLGYNYTQRESVQLQAAGKTIVRFLQAAKSYSLLDGHKNACHYVPTEHRLQESLRPRSVSIPSDIEVKASKSAQKDKVLLATFYPDGSALAGQIELRSTQKRVLIRIDPLLGKVTMQWPD
jgi:prepilin-type N-terminal cleavage/methylation domain-containing protein